MAAQGGNGARSGTVVDLGKLATPLGALGPLGGVYAMLAGAGVDPLVAILASALAALVGGGFAALMAGQVVPPSTMVAVERSLAQCQRQAEAQQARHDAWAAEMRREYQVRIEEMEAKLDKASDVVFAQAAAQQQTILVLQQALSQLEKKP